MGLGPGHRLCPKWGDYPINSSFPLRNFRAFIVLALVALPPGEFPVPLFDVVANCITIRGSFVGTSAEMAEALAFAAISAVEGLELSAAGKRCLKKTEKLTPKQRRAEIIRAYAGHKGRR